MESSSLKSQFSNKKLFFISSATVIIVAFVFLATAYFLPFYKKSGNLPPVASSKTEAELVSISGTFDINGNIPAGSYLEIRQKKAGESEFTVVESNIPPSDESTWIWKGATEGAVYELQASLVLDGKVISLPKSAMAAAPASGERLVVHSVYANPTPGISSFLPQTPAETAKSIISGSINLNGYVPQGATISVWGRKNGDSQFKIVSAGIPAADRAFWGWGEAASGSLYEFQASLNYLGAVVSVSEILSVVAPAANETLLLNSRYAPPGPKTVSISGKINLNGYIPPNSSLVISKRESGSNAQFNTVINSLSATDGTVWSWNNAQSGKSYDLQADLMVNNSVYARSEILTVSAPASYEVLTINARTLPPPPPLNSFGYNCLGKDSSSGKWQIKIGFNNNSPNKDARQYLVQLGDSSGNSSLVNTVTTPSTPLDSQSMTTNFILNDNQTYFLRYAFSTCLNCSVFSPFSPDVQVNCYTQSPSATPTPTFTPTPTMIPTPTPTIPPFTSLCNETCGSDGYSCIVGLQCIEGEMIGSSVCRNPNCTDRTDCNCI